MADRKPVYGTGKPARPGLFGALKDAGAAVVKATAPRSVVHRKAKVDEAVEGRRSRQHNTSNY